MTEAELKERVNNLRTWLDSDLPIDQDPPSQPKDNTNGQPVGDNP